MSSRPDPVETSPNGRGFSDQELAEYPTVFRDDLLKDRVFLISGGGSGFGRAMTYLVARLGAQVMICGRREEKLRETVDGIEKWVGRKVGHQAMTIRDADAVEALVEETWKRFGRIDCLVNNAGGQFPQDAIDFSVKGWNAVIDTNLNGTWYMMQAAAKRWRDAGQPGNIINIVALVERGMPQVAHTCAARAGVVGLTKTVCVEWAPLDIRVNCIAPGSLESEGLDVYPSAASELFKHSNPMKKLGDAFDVAEAVVYLAAPSGKFITGEVLTVDGGGSQWGDVWPAGMPDYFRVPGR